MYSRQRTWEVPPFAPGGPTGSDDLFHLVIDEQRPLYTKRALDHIGIIDPDRNIGAEFRLSHPDGRWLGLDYILPWPSRHRQFASLYFIAAGQAYGFVFFNMRRQKAWLIEIDRFADTQNLPPGINVHDYDFDDWFVRLTPAGMTFDHRRRIWMGAHLSPHSYWNPVLPGICRWELGIARSRYLTVWRLDTDAKGEAYRLWMDQQRRIWWVHRVISDPGGYIFSRIDPASNEIVGFEPGTVSGMALGGERDLWGLAGDAVDASLWVSWPRFRRIFKYSDIYTPPHLNTELHAYFQPQKTAPYPDNAFGQPSGLAHDKAAGIYFGNREDSYVGRLDQSAEPNEVWPLLYTPYSFTPMLMELKRTELVVEKIYEKELPVSLTPAPDYGDVDPPFAGWQTDARPENPVRERDFLWFVRHRQTLARLEP